jgi:hypothetical protein
VNVELMDGAETTVLAEAFGGFGRGVRAERGRDFQAQRVRVRGGIDFKVQKWPGLQMSKGSPHGLSERPKQGCEKCARRHRGPRAVSRARARDQMVGTKHARHRAQRDASRSAAPRVVASLAL